MGDEPAGDGPSPRRVRGAPTVGDPSSAAIADANGVESPTAAGMAKRQDTPAGASPVRATASARASPSHWA